MGLFKAVLPKSVVQLRVVEQVLPGLGTEIRIWPIGLHPLPLPGHPPALPFLTSPTPIPTISTLFHLPPLFLCQPLKAGLTFGPPSLGDGSPRPGRDTLEAHLDCPVIWVSELQQNAPAKANAVTRELLNKFMSFVLNKHKRAKNSS